MVCKFFTSISGIRDMNISFAMCKYIKDIVQFCNLSRLELELYVISLEELPKVLEKCSNLKSLILKILDCSGLRQLKLSSVPGCLLSSLEYVEIKSIYCKWYMEMELARYFTENSVVLKKLVLPLRSSMLKKKCSRLKGSPCIAEAI